MKSIKKKNGAIVPLGVILLILGIAFVIASALQENTGNGDVTHIGGDAGSVTIVTNINWLQIGLLIVGAIIMAFGVVMLTFYFLLFKGDFINVENGMVICRGDLKNYTIPLKEVEYCKSSNLNIKLKRKSDDKPITIWFIDNAYEVSTFIENEIQKHSND